jgi:hypothetical protein
VLFLGYLEQAAAAARAGNSVKAGRLGALGRRCNANMKELHFAAAELIWETKNSNFVSEGIIDCHGLHVSEVLERVPLALAEAASSGCTQMRVVVGTGHHTQAGTSRLKPAIREYLDLHSYQYTEVTDKWTKHVGAFLVKLKL